MKTAEKNLIEIFTDGAARGNPGPGGWATIIRDGNSEREFYGGFRKTTNNRMEMIAAWVGLKELGTEPKSAILYSDSRLLTDSINKRWLNSWIRKNWKKSDGNEVLNVDIWYEISELLKIHDVKFVWVKGHAGHKENERCDFLASSVADQPGLPADSNYEGLPGPDIFEVIESGDFVSSYENPIDNVSIEIISDVVCVSSSKGEAGQKIITIADNENDIQINFPATILPELVKDILGTVIE